MTDPIREAAKREITSWRSCYREPGTVVPGRVLLARAYLAEHDETPLTSEYASERFTQGAVSWKFIISKGKCHLAELLQFPGSASGFEWRLDAWRYDEAMRWQLANAQVWIRTVGELRRGLEFVGITLTEAPGQ